MLYFSKLKLIIIYFIIIFLSLFSLANFISNEDNYILSKKVNLGLDLQGGSYLLLEVDSEPLVNQKLQNKLISLRKILKDKNIKYQDLKINNSKINFYLNENDKNVFDNFFFDKENKNKKNIIKYITINFNFEKYNTKYNYFLFVGLFNKL